MITQIRQKMMEKSFLSYTKKTIFLVVYAALMVPNLIVLAFLGLDIYYEIFNPVYWREHFTMYPHEDVSIPTPLADKIKIGGFLLFCLFMCVYGNWLLYRKNKYGLLFLAWIVCVVVYNYVFIW